MPTETSPGPADLVSFAQRETQRNPFPLVDKLLAGDRIYQDPMTGIPLVVRYADIAYVYAHPEVFSSRNPLVFARSTSPVYEELTRRFEERGFPAVDTLVTNDPPSHGKFRALVDRVFTPGVIRVLQERMATIADALIDRFIEAGRVDLIPAYALLLPIYVIADQLGVPRDDWPRIKYWSDISIERITPVLPAERELAIADDLIEMQQYIWRCAEEAERSGADTLLGKLVRAEIDGERLSPAELINVATQIFVAGHETTTALIGHATLLLLDDDDLRAELAADRTLIGAFIEEALRLHPPVSGLRMVAGETELAGVRIPAGSMITLCNMTGNYDPSMFPNPKKVDLKRPNIRQHLSFGRGIHFCIGNMVARTEARIAIDRLLTRLPGMRLDRERPRPQYAAVYHAHALENLPIVF